MKLLFPPVAPAHLTQLFVVLLVQMLRVWIEIAGALRYVRLIFWILTQFVRELFRPKGIKNESIVEPFSEVQLQI